MAKIKNKVRADGRLQSKVYLGNGKYKYVYAATNKELTEKINEIKIKLGKGIDVTAERDTFGQWADRWLSIKQVEVSHGRYMSYRYRIDNLSELSSIPITKIRTIDIQDIIIKQMQEGASLKTLSESKSVCRQICQLAIDNRIMDYNPAQAVKLPKVEKQSERRALTQEEQSWITTPTNHRGQRAAMIMMYAGLRRGELLALTWKDIDLQNRTITINKSVEIINGKSYLKHSTKTEASTRIVYIPNVLAEYLASQDHGNSLIVCPDAKGNMMSESAWKRLWDSYLYELNFNFGDFSAVTIRDNTTGKLTSFQKPNSRFAPVKIPMVIPRFTAHWLRHTFITMMYFAGVDVLTAKEQAGHADIQTTMEIYTHLDGIHKEKQINKLDEYLSNCNTVSSTAEYR